MLPRLSYLNFTSASPFWLVFYFGLHLGFVLAAVLSDWRCSYVPDRYLFGQLLSLLPLLVWQKDLQTAFSHLGTQALGALLCWLPFALLYLSQQSLGGADVKWAALCGLALGYEKGLISLIISLSLACLWHGLRCLFAQQKPIKQGGARLQGFKHCLVRHHFPLFPWLAASYLPLLLLQSLQQLG